MIFSVKSLVYSSAGALFGLIVYLPLKHYGFNLVGLISILIFAAIGFAFATLKIPDSANFEITRKTGGEKIDDVILRAIKFKLKGKRIYIYTKEEKE